jgi:hypothetical protein
MVITICRQNSDSPSGRIFLRIFDKESTQPLETANAFATEAMFEETQILKTHLWILGTVASSAPFIGLLGTVVGAQSQKARSTPTRCNIKFASCATLSFPRVVRGED